MQLYCVSGLTVGSEMPLPGLNSAPSDFGQPDVTIRSGTVPDSIADASASGPTWQIAGDRFLLRIPDVARFLLTQGREIVYQSEPGGEPADIPVFILGTVFGILLHQREQIVLHASAVHVNGKAVLFCGPSGAGKSTLAAALTMRGYKLITDDVCAISMSADQVPMVHPDGRQLKLWAQAIDRLDLAAQRGERVRNRLEKYYVEPGRASAEALPLGAVYALREARPPHKPGIERPNVVDMALLLRRNAYRPRLVNHMGQKAGYFHAATTIAGSAGIYYLTRDMNFAAMPAVIAWLEQHWRDIGLAERAA